ncbi:MAG: Uncharacterized protein K0R82_849 [Flavipsychrobacter sp.]|jgi:opacity protein-like surface antigen|nr:Uncharacterized protein [Flavipsychrobacter sp.]
MKKLLLTAASALLFAGSANAQVRFAPEVGFNMSKLNYNYDFDVADDWDVDDKSFTGIRTGVAVDICIANHLTLQPGIYYSRRGGERNFTYRANRPAITPFIDQDRVLGNRVILDGSAVQPIVILSYIEIPLLLNYYFDAGPGQFFIGLGPTFSFNVGSDLHLKVNNPNNGANFDEEIDLNDGDDRLVGGTDIGLMANAGYAFDFGLFVRPFYNWGLSNLSKDDDLYTNIDINTRTFGVGFGWWFGGKNK